MSDLEAIQAAIIGGIIAAAGPTANRAIKDAYAALRSVLIDLYDGISSTISSLEKKPENESMMQALRNELELIGAADSEKVQTLASNLRSLLYEIAPDIVATVEVRLHDLSVHGDIRVEGERVIVEGDKWASQDGNAVFVAKRDNPKKN